MKTIKIKGEPSFGAIIAPEASKYLEYAVSGVEKTLIVADETVFRLYGNSIKKIIKKACEQTYTFIYPAGENGKTKHVLDKLLILMTELGIKKTDTVVAFGGRSSASIAGLATSIFKGGVPYVFVPTTLMAMLSPVTDGKVGVDFLGEKDLLRGINYPVATFIDTEYLSTLPQENLKDGYVEIIRRCMVGNGKLLKKMQEEKPDFEEMIYSALVVGERYKNKNGDNKKARFALDFSSVAEKECASGTPYHRLVAFGIVTAIDTAMALGVSYGLEEPMLELLAKYGIRWDVGLSINKLWQAMAKLNVKKVTLALPKKLGSTKIVRLTKEKIKESF